MAELETPLNQNLTLPAAANFGTVVEEEGPVVELGDRIRLGGGKYDGTTGRVIFRTQDEIHLMPDGLTHTTLKFGLDEEGFDEESGVESVEILQKRKKPGLVDILDLAPGQLLETFDEAGKPGPTYTIVKVDVDKDAITVKNEDEGEVDLDFSFRGVPDSLPFRVIRGRQAPVTAAEPVKTIVEGENDTNDYSDSESVEEVEDFTFLDDELEAPADEGVEYLIEIPTSERTYSNMTQKSEAYADLLSLNSLALQKLDTTQKTTRILTELLFQLRAAILRISEDGTPKGVKPTSIQTLIDALETRQLALSRAVVDVDKILYHDMDPDIFPQNPQPDSMDHIRYQSFDRKIAAANQYLTDATDADGQKFNVFLNGYLSRFVASWREASTPRIAFQRDEEVFRLKAPDSESNIPGYPRGLVDKKSGYVSVDFLDEVSMSMIRGLKAIRNKGQIQQLGEEASVLSYVVFPLAYAASLSTLRYESIIADVEAGLTNFMSIESIIKKAGGITEIPSPIQPFLVSVEGGTLGNIPLRDYLKTVAIKAEGMGDFWPLQVAMGMQEREWTIDQHDVLNQIIKRTHDSILEVILRQRESLAEQVAQPKAVQGIQMTPDGVQLIQKLTDEPLLKDIQQAIKDQMPSYSNSDVALVGLVLRQHPDLAFAQIAEQPAALTRMRMKYAREQYLTSVRNIQLKKQRIAFAGEPPEPIKCPHVKPLEMIRKVKDNSKRLALLAKFLTTFQGTKQDNWLKCRVGDHNLLCVHELLQIYQYLRPGDVATLNKDIQLNFGGGQFQGFYICRNCGQPISELEYDTHLEFDDMGRPMMGRSELVDKDAITLDEIDQLIGPLGDVEDEIEFDNETKKLIYITARQVADKIFAPLEMSDYITIVNRAFGIIQQIPTRERWVKLQQAQKKSKAPADVAAINADYDVYLNQALVCSVGVHILLIIQCRKPELVLRGLAAGCRSLRGQPLEPEGGTHGIQCIVSVLSSFQKDSPPWSLTQFHREKDDTLRQKIVMGIFEPILRSSLQDPTILQALSQKRDYKRKILGAAGGQGRPDEELPTNFAPIPFVMKPEDFVEKIIIPEAASDQDRAELWIRQGNHLAKTNKLPKPVAFTETSCCLSPLKQIDEFWKRSAASLPPFKRLLGLKAPPKITRTEPTMKPSVISRPLPDAPENSYYLLFLKVCYDGEQKGHSHEFGLTHKCIWCGLTLPKEAEILTADQGRSAIESQGIDVSKESFEDLLNETHRVNSFVTKLLLELPGPLDNWIKLTQMEPEPAEGYRAIMAKTQVELSKLSPDAKDVEVAVALSDFSSFASNLEQQFKTRVSPAQHVIFDNLIEAGPEAIMRFLQSYVIVPLKQFITKRSQTSKVPTSWNLSYQHQEDVAALISEHRSYLTKFNKVIATPWLNAKVETVLLQIRAVLDALASLRPLQIPGGAQTYGFFLKFCLFAPLANFVDPNTLPIAAGTEVPESQVEQQALFPARFISDMAARFKGEGFHLTPEQIREFIVERNEKEKANIIKKLGDRPKAGKEIEMIKMRLGLGDWAVGGTKGVYAYDQDRYDIERDQRAEAGIVDFPGYGPEGPDGFEEGKKDRLGYYATAGDEEGYIGDEDLGNMNGFDDDN
jgi:hypothetical protein